jgi:hypothetical protein
VDIKKYKWEAILKNKNKRKKNLTTVLPKRDSITTQYFCPVAST